MSSVIRFQPFAPVYGVQALRQVLSPLGADRMRRRYHEAPCSRRGGLAHGVGADRVPHEPSKDAQIQKGTKTQQAEHGVEGCYWHAG